MADWQDGIHNGWDWSSNILIEQMVTQTAKRDEMWGILHEDAATEW